MRDCFKTARLLTSVMFSCSITASLTCLYTAYQETNPFCLGSGITYSDHNALHICMVSSKCITIVMVKVRMCHRFHMCCKCHMTVCTATGCGHMEWMSEIQLISIFRHNTWGSYGWHVNTKCCKQDIHVIDTMYIMVDTTHSDKHWHTHLHAVDWHFNYGL